MHKEPDSSKSESSVSPPRSNLVPFDNNNEKDQPKVPVTMPIVPEPKDSNKPLPIIPPATSLKEETIFVMSPREENPERAQQKAEEQLKLQAQEQARIKAQQEEQERRRNEAQEKGRPQHVSPTRDDKRPNYSSATPPPVNTGPVVPFSLAMLSGSTSPSPPRPNPIRSATVSHNPPSTGHTTFNPTDILRLPKAQEKPMNGSETHVPILSPLPKPSSVTFKNSESPRPESPHFFRPTHTAGANTSPFQGQRPLNTFSVGESVQQPQFRPIIGADGKPIIPNTQFRPLLGADGNPIQFRPMGSDGLAPVSPPTTHLQNTTPLSSTFTTLLHNPMTPTTNSVPTNSVLANLGLSGSGGFIPLQHPALSKSLSSGPLSMSGFRGPVLPTQSPRGPLRSSAPVSIEVEKPKEELPSNNFMSFT